MDAYVRRRLVDASRYDSAITDAKAIMQAMAAHLDTRSVTRLKGIRAAISKYGYVPSADAGESGSYHPLIVKRQLQAIDDYIDAAETIQFPPDLDAPPKIRSNNFSIAILGLLAFICFLLILIGLAAS